jgi:hypothetical protein
VEIQEVRILEFRKPYRDEVLGMYHTDYPASAWVRGVCILKSWDGKIESEPINFQGKVDAELRGPDPWTASVSLYLEPSVR